jgi:4-hydroxy-tetrahydrodipicolinate reductase
MPPRVGLFGFGKAGRAVATVLLNSKETWLEWVVRRSHKMEHRSVPEYLGIESEEPGTIVSVQSEDYGDLFAQRPVDVIVDFSSESGVDEYGAAALRWNLPVVTAVSHYSSDVQDKLHQLSESVPVLWSPNITLGINFLLVASKILRRIAPWADVDVLEEHFRDKAEVSGTAKKLAQAVDFPVEKIKSVRAGGIIGRHEVLFGFPYQTVRLIPESISREAFGNGALFAVKNLVGKAPGLYSMEMILERWFALEVS